MSRRAPPAGRPAVRVDYCGVRASSITTAAGSGPEEPVSSGCSGRARAPVYWQSSFVYRAQCHFRKVDARVSAHARFCPEVVRDTIATMNHPRYFSTLSRAIFLGVVATTTAALALQPATRDRQRRRSRPAAPEGAAARAPPRPRAAPEDSRDQAARRPDPGVAARRDGSSRGRTNSTTRTAPPPTPRNGLPSSAATAGATRSANTTPMIWPTPIRRAAIS